MVFGANGSEKTSEDGTGSPWILQVDRDAVILIDPEFQNKKGMSKVITKKTKMGLSQVPGLGFSYLKGDKGGLMPTEEVTARLQERKKKLENSKSVSGKRKEAVLLSECRQHERIQQILTKQARFNNSKPTTEESTS